MIFAAIYLSDSRMSMGFECESSGGSSGSEWVWCCVVTAGFWCRR